MMNEIKDIKHISIIFSSIVHCVLYETVLQLRVGKLRFALLVLISFLTAHFECLFNRSI